MIFLTKKSFDFNHDLNQIKISPILNRPTLAPALNHKPTKVL